MTPIPVPVGRDGVFVRMATSAAASLGAASEGMSPQLTRASAAAVDSRILGDERNDMTFSGKR